MGYWTPEDVVKKGETGSNWSAHSPERAVGGDSDGSAGGVGGTENGG